MKRVMIPGMRRLAGFAGLLALLTAPVMAKQSLLVFPADKPEDVEQSVADTVATALAAYADAGTAYATSMFYAKSPLVVRATNSGAITAEQMTGPFSAESAAGIARAIGADAVLIATLEEATFDEAANKASVTVSVQVVSSTDAKVLKTAAASAESAKAATPSAAQLRLAANDAAAKAGQQLFGSTAKPVTPTVTKPVPGNTAGGKPPVVKNTATVRKHKINKTGLILGGLIVAGVIAAVSGGGGGGGNGGSDGPPPIPL